METVSSRRTSRRWTHVLGTGATAVVVAAAFASTAGAAPTNPPAGARGSVAALSGTSMEVQNPTTGQTTVSWTATTQFSKTVSESVSSLNAGDCVAVTGTASKTSKTTIAARSITVTMPTSTGSCTGQAPSTANGAVPGRGFQFGGGAGTGGGGFFRANGGSGTRPSFPGGGSGSSNFRKAFASLSIASGKVTAVNGATLTVSGIDISPGTFPRPTSSKSSKSSKTTKPTPPKTETLKVTTTSSTPVSATQSAASTDLAVGECVTAFGPAATNGSVTATTVRISSATNGSCTGAFGRFGGAGGGGAAFFGGPGGGSGGGGA